MQSWRELFNDRQLLALSTFARLVGESYHEMCKEGLDAEYAGAVTTYLGLALDRLANTNSTLARLMSAGGRGIVGTFARQALPMVWDYAEANPFSTSASWSTALDGVTEPLDIAASLPNNSNEVRITLDDAKDPRNENTTNCGCNRPSLL